MNNTEKALLARGIDSALAEKLIEKGFTVKKLQTLKEDDLITLGLSDAQVKTIHSSPRPPIDPEVVVELLYRCGRQCCVCRKPRQPIIIHHIAPWKESKDHGIDNLVVLCLHCHDEAHTKRDLSQNLTPELIRCLKKKWESEVHNKNFRSLIEPNPCSLTGAIWDYFNHKRLLDLANNLQLDLSEFFASGFNEVPLFPIQADSPETSSLNQDQRNARYLYFEAFNPRTIKRYNFFQQILYEILSRIEFVDLTSNWTKSSINSIVKQKTLITCTGPFRFKWLHPRNAVGQGQIREGYRRKGGIKIQFKIDGWESTSASAHASHLSGTWVSTSILLTRNVIRDRDRDLLIINCTCLAIGTGFTDYQGDVPEIAWNNAE